MPTYSDSKSTGIVHFGVGNFHRAHEAMYVDRILTREPQSPWGICGVGVLPSDVRMKNVLIAQDGLYTLVLKQPDGTVDARVIGSITEYLFAPDGIEAVIGKLAARSTHIVSLTITEGGYAINDATGKFEPNEAMLADIDTPEEPRTVFGLIVEGLRRRRAARLPAFTIMSCDNIPGNGAIARAAVVGMAERIDLGLAGWIAENGRFPNSMVDRITPVTTEQGIAEVAERFGILDQWPVIAEAYEQWVLEDAFADGRPDFEAVGVQLVADVTPYELMKLRLLNASHQAMSYLGLLAGHTMVHDVARDPDFALFLRGYMAREAVPTLRPVPGVDLEAYQASLMHRFASSAIADTLDRQVVDGSDRIPKFLLPVLRAQLDAGGPIDHVTLVIAAWSLYLVRRDASGVLIPPPDRRADVLVAAALAEEEHPGALLELQEVFAGLGQNRRLREGYLVARRALIELGALSAVFALNQSTDTLSPLTPVRPE